MRAIVIAATPHVSMKRAAAPLYKSVDVRAVVWSALQRWERAVQEGIRRRYAVEHANLP